MNESPILKILRSETIVKLIIVHDNIWAVQGDDDALLFCGIIAPQFGDPKWDEEAVRVLSKAFPDLEV
nr:agmatine deiminase isoform X1 [Tanacetum cinerariifolium]